MSSKLKSPKTNSKTTNKRRIQDTQVRMHARAHLLTMKNQKIIKQQKRLNKERAGINKELDETSSVLAGLKAKQNEIISDLQTSVSFTTDGLLLEAEEKYSTFLNKLLGSLEKEANQPIADNGETEEELQEILKELEEENERLENDENSLHKNKHIERLNGLVEDVTEETEKHEKEAREAEVELQKTQMERREEEIISKQLDIWLSRANDRKDNAITELSMIDIKKKHAIVKRAQARARREEMENQAEEIAQKEQELAKDEEQFFEESNYAALEEEEILEEEAMYSTQRIDKTQLILERQKKLEDIGSIIDDYQSVLSGDEKREKEEKLKNENYDLYKMEEKVKWDDHWESKQKEADDNIKELERANRKEELQNKVEELEKEIEELTAKGAAIRSEIESTEGLVELSEKECEETEPIVIPDHKTEILNIQKELDSLSLRKAAAEREIIRQKALKDAAESANVFLLGVSE